MLFDVRDRAFIEDPYPTLNALRESAPIHWDADTELWLLTRHEDVKAAQLDRRFGRVLHGHAEPQEFRPIRELDLDNWEPYYRTERHSLLMLEPPEHSRLRGLVSKAFTPSRVRLLRGPITKLADDLLDAIGAPTFDLLADYSAPYSIGVIAMLLGAPIDDADQLLEWSHSIVKMYELSTTREQANNAIEASAEFTEWTMQLMAERRERPTDDLITALCHAETDDGVLSDDEIVSTVILLLNAGHEATVNTMGNGIVSLMKSSDDAWSRVASGEVVPSDVTEEMMRFDPPLQMFERYALADDIEIAGQSIRPGEKVAMLFGAANRDPRAFDDPDTFVVDRADASHVTFGAGVHHCLGAPLARVELGVAVERLAKAFPNLSLGVEPRREDGFVIRGFESVEVVP